ncbi:hypothetical protein [Occallatibacter savannae]|uniref:hypothetical protein n=1 Tax=Occallatibacter savannae TaxID=1002691 RepID=UPI00194FBB42|nr:hypothetical protein [Occallatibacter savannae]
MQDLTPTQIAIIAAVVLVVIGAIIVFAQRRRSEKLRSRFGPEYERSVAESGDRRRAEAQLEKRAERVEKFHLRALTAEDRSRFTEQWDRVQAHFVDAPAGAVAEADQLLGDIMATCGYPMGDFEQRAADVSVDHPVVVQNYRAAHEIALRQAKGQATTEDLRRAMIHYRALFEDIVYDRKEAVKDRGPVVVDRREAEREEIRRRAS